MRKQTIEYDSPLDALVALAKRLSGHEMEHQIESEEFYHKYCKGEMPDDSWAVEWAGDYQHYIAIRQQLQRQLKYVA